MKFLNFLIKNPFYIGYSAILIFASSTLIFNIGGTLDGFIDAPIVVQILGSISIIGGAIACVISMVKSYPTS
jgi:hypothetical protein